MNKVVVENNLDHKPKKRSKKILIIGVVLFLLVIMACHFFRFPPLIKAKANLYYGAKVCSCNGLDVEVGCPVVSINFCPLCCRIEKRGMSTENHICYECRKIIGRCTTCYGIKTDLPIFTINRDD